MKIKMLTSISGSDMAARPGEVVDVDAELAARLIDTEQAERVRSGAEAAAAPPAPETAMTDQPQPRRRKRRG